MIDFELTDEQRMIAEAARDFATRELLPVATRRDEEGLFPAAEMRALARLGLLGVNVPASLGGAEAGSVAYSLAMQEIARADCSVAVTMAVTNMVAEVICAFGTDEQKRRYVPRLCSGEAVAGAFGLSEPQAGSDPASMTTRATRTPDGWRLDGAKQWITSGDRAGVLVVWARTELSGDRSDARSDGRNEPGSDGRSPSRGQAPSGSSSRSKAISAFVVEGGTPGLSAGKHERKMGLRGSSTVPLLFDDCRLGEDALLGHLGDGMKIALTALDGGRIGIASQAVGTMRAALEHTTSYVKQRHQFGRPLASNQAIQFRLADVATQHDVARLLTLRAAHLKEQHRPFSREAAMAKLYATEACGRAVDAAVQLHGGYGYTREFPVERLMRDARVQRIYEGTSEVQRIVIARSLLSSLPSSSG